MWSKEAKNTNIRKVLKGTGSVMRIVRATIALARCGVGSQRRSRHCQLASKKGQGILKWITWTDSKAR